MQVDEFADSNAGYCRNSCGHHKMRNPATHYVPHSYKGYIESPERVIEGASVTKFDPANGLLATSCLNHVANDHTP